MHAFLVQQSNAVAARSIIAHNGGRPPREWVEGLYNTSPGPRRAVTRDSCCAVISREYATFVIFNH